MLHLEKKAIRRLVKQEILKGFDENELVRLTFSEKEAEALEWEHSKEFKFNNHYYDVVRKEVKNGQITYICWLDKQETEINKKLDGLIADVLEGMPVQNEPTKALNKLLQSLYLDNYPNFNLFFPSPSAQKIHVGEDEDLINLSYEPLVPPPNAG